MVQSIMYAILSHGGHQYRVAPGDRLLVDRLDAAVGATVQLPSVLFVGHDGDQAGRTDVPGATVTATVVSHPRGPKLRIFKYKPKKRRRVTHGHRSDLTELRIEALAGAAEKR